MKKGANRKHIIIKSPDYEEGQGTISRLIKLEKVDKAKHMVYGLVYSPNDVSSTDTDDEFATAGEIEKACELFMKQGMTPNVDVRHSWEKEGGAFIRESWLVKSNDPLFPEDVDGWAVGIKVENDELWSQVEKGEIAGLSLGGFADKIPVEKNDSKGGTNNMNQKETLLKEEQENLSFMAKVGGAIRSMVSKESSTFEEVVDYRQFWQMFYALEEACSSVLRDEELDHKDKMAKIAQSLEQFKASFATLKTEKIDTTQIEKDGRVFSKSNYDKLVSMLDTLQKLVDQAKAEKADKEGGSMEMEKAFKELQEKVEKLEKKVEPPAADQEKVTKAQLDELSARIVKLETPGTTEKGTVPAGATGEIPAELQKLQKAVEQIGERIKKLENPEPTDKGDKKSEVVEGIEKSLKEISERLEKVEKARGISHKEETTGKETPTEKVPMTGPVTPKTKHFG